MRARIPASSGYFAMNREISVCERLRGGPGRTRTSNQAVMSLSRRKHQQKSVFLIMFIAFVFV
jgi:hypothetical protein